jgi:hypothetical protein
MSVVAQQFHDAGQDTVIVVEDKDAEGQLDARGKAKRVPSAPPEKRAKMGGVCGATSPDL